MDATREAFEAWCIARWRGDRGGDNFQRFETDGPYVGQYRKGNVEFAWCAWQAALAAAPQRGPLTEEEIDAECDRLRMVLLPRDLAAGVRFAERVHQIPGAE